MIGGLKNYDLEAKIRRIKIKVASCLNNYGYDSVAMSWLWNGLNMTSYKFMVKPAAGRRVTRLLF